MSGVIEKKIIKFTLEILLYIILLHHSTICESISENLPKYEYMKDIKSWKIMDII